MATNLRCTVIGAGAVGLNAALLLDAYGIQVTLVEANNHALMGAPQTSFINHSDGFEYYKPRHRRTGEHCVEGGITKALFYRSAEISTAVCTDVNRIRFLVARGAVEEGRIVEDGFLENATHMNRHYAKLHRRVSSVIGSRADDVFSRTPSQFMRVLSPSDYDDVSEIVCGVAGSGFGINMPNYYSVGLAALRQSNVRYLFGAAVDSITRPMRANEYVISSGGNSWAADHVLVCASHKVPGLVANVVSPGLAGRANVGTYYLNAMTFIGLPATSDAARISKVSRINFTLMEQHGCMMAAIVPPSAEKAGLAAIYFPHPTGSQLDSHASMGASRPPDSWHDKIRDGLPNDHSNVRTTFAQALRLYPLLRDYASVSHTQCRTVFNAGVPGSDNGRDRRVREIDRRSHAVTEDGRVSAWTSPKWTNAELSALHAVDHVLQTSGRRRLPRSEVRGCGPERLDVAEISSRIHFRDIKGQATDALEYATLARLPVEMLSQG